MPLGVSDTTAVPAHSSLHGGAANAAGYIRHYSMSLSSVHYSVFLLTVHYMVVQPMPLGISDTTACPCPQFITAYSCSQFTTWWCSQCRWVYLTLQHVPVLSLLQRIPAHSSLHGGAANAAGCVRHERLLHTLLEGVLEGTGSWAPWGGQLLPLAAEEVWCAHRTVHNFVERIPTVVAL